MPENTITSFPTLLAADVEVILGSQLSILIRLLNESAETIVGLASALSEKEKRFRQFWAKTIILGGQINEMQSRLELDIPDDEFRNLSAGQRRHEVQSEMYRARTIREARLRRIGEKRPDWLMARSDLNRVFGNVEQVARLQRYLRAMVTAWVDTGLAQGVDGLREIPQLRTLRKIDSAGWRLREKHEKEPVEWLYERLLSQPIAFNAELGSASAEQEYKLHIVRESGYGIDDVFSEMRATMGLLLLSTERLHISKCRECAIFFWRERVSAPKGLLYCGTKCQNKATARLTTIKRRRNEKQGKLSQARQLIEKYEQMPLAEKLKHPDWKAWLSRKLHDDKTTWITWHITHKNLTPPRSPEAG